jgi:TP901 family phage tail tape measure protein
MGLAETAKLVAELKLDAKQFTAGFKKAMSSADNLDKRLGKIGKAGAASAARNIERAALLGAGAAAAGITFAVKSAIDWESAMAGVNKTIEATPAELADIEKGLIALSNKTPIAATDLAAIAEAAGALGIAKQDIISFTETVAIIGSTTNVTTEDAATALGQLGNVLRLTGDDYDNFAAALVDLGNKGASTEAQILEIARRAGGGANLIGVAKDATLGWAAAAANLGMNEELAGTSLQNMFLKAMPAFTKGSKTLQQVTGQTAAQLKKSFSKDASGAIESLLVDLGKMPKDARLEAVQKLFGKGSGLTRLVLGLSDSMDRNLAPSLDTATQAWAENTAATEEAEKRFKTTEAQLAILKNNVTNAATTIGTNLLPLVNELASELTTWIQGHQGEIKQFGMDLAAGIKEAVKWAKSLDWDKITASLQMGAGVAKGIVSAFTSAPPWLQTFLAGGFLANKFTGGALGDAIGAIFKAVIPSMMVRAGLVNLSGPVAGGGPGGAVPVGGKTGAVGKIGSVAGAIGKVFLVGMAAAVAVELASALGQQSTEIQEQGKDLVNTTKDYAPGMTEKEIVAALAAVRAPTKDPLSTIALLVTNPLNKGFDNLLATEKTLQDQLAVIRANTATTSANTGSGAERAAAQTAQLAGVKAAALESARAIRAKKWDVDVQVNVPVRISTKVSINDITKVVITSGRYNGKITKLD